MYNIYQRKNIHEKRRVLWAIAISSTMWRFISLIIFVLCRRVLFWRLYFSLFLLERIMPTALNLQLHVNGDSHIPPPVIWPLPNLKWRMVICPLPHAKHSWREGGQQYHWITTVFGALPLIDIRDDYLLIPGQAKNKTCTVPLFFTEKIHAYFLKNLSIYMCGHCL